MKVCDLMRELSKYDSDVEVQIGVYSYDSGEYEVHDVEEITQFTVNFCDKEGSGDSLLLIPGSEQVGWSV